MWICHFFSWEGDWILAHHFLNKCSLIKGLLLRAEGTTFYCFSISILEKRSLAFSNNVLYVSTLEVFQSWLGRIASSCPLVTHSNTGEGCDLWSYLLDSVSQEVEVVPCPLLFCGAATVNHIPYESLRFNSGLSVQQGDEPPKSQCQAGRNG